MDNYFNFTRPVTVPEHFAGRQAQLATVRYYLQRHSPAHPTNLMILGARGIGKTSLLNVAQAYAAEEGHTVVRCDLDERIVSDDTALFTEIFDELAAVFMAEVPHGDDRHGSGPFPTNSRSDLYATDAGVQKSLRGLTALGIADHRRLVVLLDEADVLARNVTLMQRLRNTMASAPRVQLIIASVGDLLRQDTSAYSPFGRSFTTLRITPFQAIEETAECIRLPLAMGGFHGEVPEDFVRTVHELAQGHPYLIQLVCHTWLRDNQTSDEIDFTISPETLREMWLLSYDLPYPEIGEFWRRVRDARDSPL